MAAVVIGAGIIGLSCAVEIQKTFPAVKVILIAERFSPDTVSDVSAGHWRPSCLGAQQDLNLARKWGADTFKFLQNLCKEPDIVKYGVTCASGYKLYEKKVEELPFWHDVVMNFRRVPYSELCDLGWPQFQDGFFFTTYHLEPTKYLDHLIQKFKFQGGIVIKQKLTSLDEVKNVCKCEFNVIINASGLGSYWLVDDKECFPVRGQIYRVKAPFQKHFISTPDNYILLNNNVTILGGCYQQNDYRTSLDDSDSRKIWDGSLKLIPALKDCKVIGQQVGLRPGRSKIRLELEYVALASINEEKPVIHCYGHGGSGVTLFYGCVKDVVDLCKPIFGVARSKL